MKKNVKITYFALVLCLIVFAGCATTKSTSPDVLMDNQQIITTVNEASSRSDCDTLFITCIDYRYAAANQDFINETLKLQDNYDHISIPGSIYNFINPDTRDLVFSKFALSVSLHLINRVVVICHKDCGAYGGSVSFGSELSEYETICSDLRKARALLIEKYPTLEVTLFLESLQQDGDTVKVNFEKIL